MRSEQEKQRAGGVPSSHATKLEVRFFGFLTGRWYLTRVVGIPNCQTLGGSLLPSLPRTQF